jgi:hypothetical protein
MVCDIASGTVRPFLERRNSERFKGVNDLTFDSRGNLYFTDQGQTGLHDPTGRLYRLRPSGELDLLLGNVPSPNGVALSADERVLYLGVTRGNQVWRVPLLPDGSVAKVSAFFTSYGPSGPDGLAVDQRGRVIVANPGLGVAWVLNHKAEPEIVLRSCAGASLTNLAFGGPNARLVLHRIDQRLGVASRARRARSADPSIGLTHPFYFRRLPMKASDLFVKALEKRGRRPHLRGSRRREPRRRRVASHLEHPARPDPARAVGRVHGGDIWPADRPPWRLHGDARPRRAEPGHRRRLCASRRDADVLITARRPS